MLIATCNSIDALSPELRARFADKFFFDAPDAQERAGIWKILRGKWNIPANEPNPDDEGWVGREIAECCKKAHRLKLSLAEASQYVVPVTKSSSELIHNLRVKSSNKFLSASRPGLYQYHETGSPATSAQSVVAEAPRGRVLRMED